MATRLKIVEQIGTDLDALKFPDFRPAPTRKHFRLAYTYALACAHAR